ncbi:MAG: isopropylmalate isomerase [Candidatus Adiutrix intracellularis]|jgi:3-isopropylmalate/(R)-2-methylmalate dehydratase large subunit|nr:MAG: isopropylmalate isomerase [Candidatus Adiutrix intracellularis]MDR2827674.1 3-isopropylmalate dehydratase large subunit [Candidatus Adiutrix intracellularis]
MASLLDKIWDAHIVERIEGTPDLLYVDRHLVHEVTSPQAFEALRLAGRKVRRPDLTFAVIDHSIPTDDRSRPLQDEVAEAQLAALEKNQAEFGLTIFFGDTDPRQGVIHVTMPEQGIVLPGYTVVCGDSHTASHGALGALAFGIGTSEVEHVLATQTIYQAKPRQMAVEVRGVLPPSVAAKDLILHIINVVGVAGGNGHAIEYWGDGVTALSVESRLTLSNMTIECGAKIGLIAPDDITFKYLKGRPLAPDKANWTTFETYWRALFTDPGHKFDRQVSIDASEVLPRATWGTNPAQSVPLSGRVPGPGDFSDPAEQIAVEKALRYQNLQPGIRLADIPIDYVFIGSCTNGRIEDLREAASILKGRRLAKGVTALVVPGSGLVKAQAEREGLAAIFTAAGCQFREAGCSMCLGMNPDFVPSGFRCASTSNRNFEDRQGRGSRTHLLSPAAAAATAVCGRLTDPREFM